MKKSILILVGIAVLLIIAIVLGGMFFLRYEDVQPFDVNAYQTELETYTSELVLGRVSDTKDAAKKARSVWYDTYGLHAIINQTYFVFYDSQADIYMVKGAPPKAEGGSPYILLNAETGAVLALWHEK